MQSTLRYTVIVVAAHLNATMRELSKTQTWLLFSPKTGGSTCYLEFIRPKPLKMKTDCDRAQLSKLLDREWDWKI